MCDGSEISVIVCTHTEARWDYLVEAVNSVLNQDVPPIEIIVVVDHNPELFERVQLHFPELKVIDNFRSKGISGARNSGIEAASGEVIAFLDDDAIAKPDWLKQLNKCYLNSDVIGAGGSILPLWQSKRPQWFPEEFLWVVGCNYKGLPQGITPVRNVIGCNMSLRREALNVIEGFREEIGRTKTSPSGCDETELCIRLRQKIPNKVILYNPYAEVYHYVPTDRVSWNYFYKRCFMEGWSKALVTRFVGSKDGLASERTYVLKVLPYGIKQGLKEFFFHADLHGLARSAAISMGLSFTIVGYLLGMVKNGRIQPALKQNAVKPFIPQLPKC
jgi:glycosyltransferase involved in cell wall biosynthesis